MCLTGGRDMIMLDDETALQLKRLVQQVFIVAFTFPPFYAFRFLEPVVILLVDVLFEWLKTGFEPEAEQEPEPQTLALTP